MPRSNSGITLNEITKLASECNHVNLRGEDVIEFLKGKGFRDPIEKWYDIRRWMKSNAPSMYANIPMAMRVEIKPESYNQTTREEIEGMRGPNFLPQRKPGDYKPPTEKVEVQNKDGTVSVVKLYGKNENQTESEQTPEGTTPPELSGFVPVAPPTPKKRGRKPGTKIQGIKDAQVETADVKRSMRLKITELESEKFKYSMGDGQNAMLCIIRKCSGYGDQISLTKDEAMALMEEIGEAVRTLFEEE